MIRWWAAFVRETYLYLRGDWGAYWRWGFVDGDRGLEGFYAEVTENFRRLAQVINEEFPSAADFGQLRGCLANVEETEMNDDRRAVEAARATLRGKMDHLATIEGAIQHFEDAAGDALVATEARVLRTSRRRLAREVADAATAYAEALSEMENEL